MTQPIGFYKLLNYFHVFMGHDFGFNKLLDVSFGPKFENKKTNKNQCKTMFLRFTQNLNLS